MATPSEPVLLDTNTGRHVFDIALAATVLDNGVKTIFTFDEPSLKTPGLVAVAP